MLLHLGFDNFIPIKTEKKFQKWHINGVKIFTHFVTKSKSIIAAKI
jgi:hypothetical protein